MLNVRTSSVNTCTPPAPVQLTELGQPAVAAYAARSGLSVDDYAQQLGEPLTPEIAGRAIVDLLQRNPDPDVVVEYLLTSGGLQPLAGN